MSRRQAIDSLLAVLFVALILPTTRAAAGDAEGEFTKGLELFHDASRYRGEHPSDRAEIARRYRRAAEAFDRTWDAGGQSARVLANAGNAHWFAGQLGDAVLAYSRALAIDPSDEVARAGLETVRESLPIRATANPARASLRGALFFWHRDSTFNQRRWCFIALFPLAFLLFFIELRLRRRPSPFGLFACLGWLSLVVSLCILGTLVWDIVERNPADRAVVIAEVTGRNGDGDEYSPSHTRGGEPAPFPPGTELRVLEQRPQGDTIWLRCDLLDGSRTWVPARATERVIERP